MQNNAQDPGWKPGTPLTSAHATDASRTGRPENVTQPVEQAVIHAVTKMALSHPGRELRVHGLRHGET